MYSLERQRDIDELDLFLFGSSMPGPICDSYGTRGMTAQERHEMKHLQPRNLPAVREINEEPISLGAIAINNQTGEITIR